MLIPVYVIITPSMCVHVSMHVCVSMYVLLWGSTCTTLLNFSYEI